MCNMRLKTQGAPTAPCKGAWKLPKGLRLAREGKGHHGILAGLKVEWAAPL